MKCCYIDTSGFGPDAIKILHPKARKEHVCCECGEIIKKGEIYEKVTGIWQSRPDTFKTCSICERIRDDYFCEDFFYGRLERDLFECLGVGL